MCANKKLLNNSWNDYLALSKDNDRVSNYVQSVNGIFKGFLEVNWRCNFQCVHCVFNRDEKMRKKRELSFEEICSILRKFANAGVFHLLFSGGEPFLRPDIWKILEFAKRLGFRISINSNGSLISEKAVERLKDIGLNEFIMTVYGYSEESYRKVTKSNHSYGKVMKAIELLTEMKRKRELVNFSVKMSIFRESFFDLENLVKLKNKLEKAGVGMSLNWHYNICSDGDNKPLGHLLSPSQLEYIVSRFPELFKTSIKGDELGESRSLCGFRGGQAGLFVNAFGLLVPCPMIDRGVSLLNNKSIRSIINTSPLFKQFCDATYKDHPECLECDKLPFCAPCAVNYFQYAGSVRSKSVPKELCNARKARLKKKLYEKYCEKC